METHSPSPWYEISNIDQIDSPALVVYPERINYNIDHMIQIAGSPEVLRPHVKTYKMEEIVRMQMAKRIRKFKCATISEAEMLGNAEVDEVLLAYQPVGPKIQRLVEIVRHFPNTKFAALVDHQEAATAMAHVFHQVGQKLNVFLDLDVGMHRTGVPANDQAVTLYLFCKQLKGIQPVGLHVYDGHIRDTDLQVRKAKCEAGFKMAEALAQRITEIDKKRPILVVGGTPTFPIHAQRQGVECSPGTCLLWDWGYHQALPEQTFQFAALVISRVISKTENNLICTDLGHKSIASENPHPRVHFLNLPDAKAVSQSEEHLVLDVGNNEKFTIGQVLYGVPIHICPTVALYGKAYIIENQTMKTIWQVAARNRMITI